MSRAVSIVMPCFNVARFLPDALACLFRQTLSDFEILAVDDGSTDETRRILAEAAARDARLRVLTGSHGGVSCARNRALDAACGRYVFFIDADDTVSDDFLETVFRQLEATQADVCFTNFRMRYGEDGPWLRQTLSGEHAYADNAAIRSRFLPRIFGYSLEQAARWGRRLDMGVTREPGFVWRTAFRRTALERGSVRFDESLVLNEDALFICEALLYCTGMTAVDRPLYGYTVRRGGAMCTHNRDATLFTNKLRMLARRKVIDRLSGGTLTDQYRASCVFSVLEMLHALPRLRAGRMRALRALRTYLGDPVVAEAFARFPLPRRRPCVALLLVFLRVISRSSARRRVPQKGRARADRRDTPAGRT